MQTDLMTLANWRRDFREGRSSKEWLWVENERCYQYTQVSYFHQENTGEYQYIIQQLQPVGQSLPALRTREAKKLHLIYCSLCLSGVKNYKCLSYSQGKAHIAAMGNAKLPLKEKLLCHERWKKQNIIKWAHSHICVCAFSNREYP